jgi:hypothetical protein
MSGKFLGRCGYVTSANQWNFIVFRPAPSRLFVVPPAESQAAARSEHTPLSIADASLGGQPNVGKTYALFAPATDAALTLEIELGRPVNKKSGDA